MTKLIDPIDCAATRGAAKQALESHRSMLPAAEQVTAERERVARALENYEALLKDPNAVHLNMLRGGIAKPSWEQIKHLYPEQFVSPAPADQADEIERWKNEASKKDAELTIARSQLETERRTVETMDNNHRSMASLLADTGRERDKLAKQLLSARSEALEECAKIADHNWSLMLTKAENRDVARKVAAEISKSIRDQIPHLTDDVREEPGYTQYTSFRP